MLDRREYYSVTGPYLCYVTNFTSRFTRPRTYTYRGCSFVKSNNVLCAKSIEGKSERCHHNPRQEGKHKPFFWFQVILSDANAGGPPLYATIFESAQKLLGIGPVEFQTMEEQSQTLFLHGICKTMPLVVVWIQCSAPTHAYPRASFVVQNLEKVQNVTWVPNNLPVYTTSTFCTPSRHEESSSTAMSSSAGHLQGKVIIDEAEVEKLALNLMEYLAALSTIDK